MMLFTCLPGSKWNVKTSDFLYYLKLAAMMEAHGLPHLSHPDKEATLYWFGTWETFEVKLQIRLKKHVMLCVHQSNMTTRQHFSQKRWYLAVFLWEHCDATKVVYAALNDPKSPDPKPCVFSLYWNDKDEQNITSQKQQIIWYKVHFSFFFKPKYASGNAMSWPSQTYEPKMLLLL